MIKGSRKRGGSVKDVPWLNIRESNILVETNFEASETLLLKVFQSLKYCLKARLLKHDFPVHGSKRKVKQEV